MAQQWQAGWLDRIREWPAAGEKPRHGAADMCEPHPAPKEPCGPFIQGRVDLSVVGSYHSVQTFAASFHQAGTLESAPRRMIGTEETLRDFLAQGNCPQARLEDAVKELKSGHRVTLQSFQLSRENQRRYFLR